LKAGALEAPNRLGVEPAAGCGVPKRGVDDVFAKPGVGAAPKAGVLAPPKLKDGV
jgi:hypothetical protein